MSASEIIDNFVIKHSHLKAWEIQDKMALKLGVVISIPEIVRIKNGRAENIG